MKSVNQYLSLLVTMEIFYTHNYQIFIFHRVLLENSAIDNKLQVAYNILTTSHFITGIIAIWIIITPKICSNAKTRCLTLYLIIFALTIIFIFEVWTVSVSITNYFLWDTRSIATGKVSFTACATYWGRGIISLCKAPYNLSITIPISISGKYKTLLL